MANSKDVTAQAFALMQKALEESEASVGELQTQLRRGRPTQNVLEKRLDVLEHKLQSAEGDRDRWKTEAGQFEEVIANLHARLERQKDKLEIAESGPDSTSKKEVNFWRARAESIDDKVSEYKTRLTSLRQELSSRDKELDQLRATLSKGEEQLAIEIGKPEESTAANSLKQQLTALKGEHSRSQAELEKLKPELGAALSQRDQAQERLTQINSAAEISRAESTRITESVRQKLSERETELQELNAQTTLLQAESTRLQDELKRERECNENLSELANDRLDELNRHRERYEEAEERYDEAEWRLGIAGRFQSLAIKRQSLASSLVAAIRSKDKSNSALKAGIDSLRRYKANAQEKEQLLLADAERLKSEIGRLKEAAGQQRADSSSDSSARRSSDQLMIDALKREVADLQDQLKAMSQSQSAGGTAEHGVKNKTEEYESKIKQLAEEADAWKRKYEFLSTNAPEAYQAQSAE